MKKLIYLLLSFLFVINVTNAQNVDSFTVSNPNPVFGHQVELINLSTNYTSLQWVIPGKDYIAGSGFPNDSVATITPDEIGCFEVKLIVGRGTKYDTVTKKCAFDVPHFLKLNGKNPDTIDVLYPYIEHGVSVDTSIWFNKKTTLEVKTNVVTNVVGKYTIKYFLKYLHGKVMDSVERTVYVVDRTPPVFSLYKAIDTIEVYHSYHLPIVISDNYCKISECKIHTTSHVDTSKLGTYTFNIWVEDCSGNFSDTQVVTVYVVDATPPVIKWHKNILIMLGICRGCKDTLKFNLWDFVEVTDNYDTNLKVTMSGTYFTDYLINFEEGYYNIIFNAKDFSGNKADSVTIVLLLEYNSIPETPNPIATIFPNPSNGTFKLDITNPELADFVRIIDMTGKQILTVTYLQQSNEITLPDYCHGIYLLQLVNKEGVFTEKIYIK